MRRSSRCCGTRHQAESVDYAAVRSGSNLGLRIITDSASCPLCGAPHNAEFERELRESLDSLFRAAPQSKRIHSADDAP